MFSNISWLCWVVSQVVLHAFFFLSLQACLRLFVITECVMCFGCFTLFLVVFNIFGELFQLVFICFNFLNVVSWCANCSLFENIAVVCYKLFYFVFR